MESVFVILMQAFTDRFFLFTGAVQFTDPVLSRRKRPRDLSAPLALNPAINGIYGFLLPKL